MRKQTWKEQQRWAAALSATLAVAMATATATSNQQNASISKHQATSNRPNQLAVDCILPDEPRDEAGVGEGGQDIRNIVLIRFVYYLRVLPTSYYLLPTSYLLVPPTHDLYLLCGTYYLPPTTTDASTATAAPVTVTAPAPAAAADAAAATVVTTTMSGSPWFSFSFSLSLRLCRPEAQVCGRKSTVHVRLTAILPHEPRDEAGVRYYLHE